MTLTCFIRDEGDRFRNCQVAWGHTVLRRVARLVGCLLAGQGAHPRPAARRAADTD